jgi:glycosyltransferase involved in cell wall biosynthesis
MKIGIDARFLTHPQPGGFKTYTRNLITALAGIDTENEYILYTDRLPVDQSDPPGQPNFSARVVPGLLPVIGMPWREQVGLARQVTRDRIDIFHSPCLTAPLNLACPLVITVHDMIWAFPEKYSQSGSWSIKREFMALYNRLVPKYAIRRASAIITVSLVSKNNIIELLGLNADLIFVTHEAAGSSFQLIRDVNSIESMRRNYDLCSDYILALGAADPRKNIKTLIQAYGLLSEELRGKYQLVIVWTHPFLADEISKQVEELGLMNHVRFLRQVSNDDLAMLYTAASLFVFPSHYEGFGLPLLEAMACGAPVIAADNSSIPEIVGEAALLFDAQDVNEMSSVMHQVLTDETVKMRLQKDGLKRSAQFSWNMCGRETIAVYNSVFDKR